jgi:hypothetical protein
VRPRADRAQAGFASITVTVRLGSTGKTAPRGRARRRDRARSSGACAGAFRDRAPDRRAWISHRRRRRRDHRLRAESVARGE